VSITAENGFVLATSTFSQVPVPSTTRLVGTVLTLCLADKNVKIAGMKIYPLSIGQTVSDGIGLSGLHCDGGVYGVWINKIQSAVRHSTKLATMSAIKWIQ